MKLYVVCTHRGDSNENTQYTVIIILASARQNLLLDLYNQQKLRSACTSTQNGKGSRLFLFE